MLTDDDIRERIDDGSLAIENIEDLDDQLNSVGVDLRVGPDYKRSGDGQVRDARNDPNAVLRFEPHTFYNVRTEERVSLPDNVVGLINGRSTLERAGLGVRGSGTVDPGFEGVLEFGVYNYTDSQITVDLGYPVVQISFIDLEDSVGVPYGERESSRYQGQEGVSGPEDFV